MLFRVFCFYDFQPFRRDEIYGSFATLFVVYFAYLSKFLHTFANQHEIFPSFALALILIFVILLALVLTAVGFSGAQNATLSLSVVDDEGSAVSGATVQLAGSDATYLSNEFGVVPDITVPLGTTVTVNATSAPN